MLKRILSVFLTILMLVPVIFSNALAADIKSTRTETKYIFTNAPRKEIFTHTYYKPNVWSTLNADGSLSVLTRENTPGVSHIFEFDANGVFKRKVVINDAPFTQVTDRIVKTGDFISDAAGNYYILYGVNLAEGAVNDYSVVLYKYSKDGVKLDDFQLKAQTGDRFTSVKLPFDSGNCRLEISGNKIAAYFGRQMFRAPDGLNHQSSYGFILDTQTMERVDKEMPYVSHSFNQFILPIDGGFMFADRGDAYPRAFRFSTVTNAGLKSVDSFTFKQGSAYQNTFSELGGVAKTSTGYLMVGTYERSAATSAEYNDSRNIMLLTVDNNLTQVSSPIWLTAYADKSKYNAVLPHIVGIGGDKFVVMWNIYSRSWETNYVNNSIQYVVVDKSGNMLTQISALPGVDPIDLDPPIYNPVTGRVMWAVATPHNDGSTGHITVYSFNPLA